MQRTRASTRGFAAALVACLAAVACGSRNGLDTCAFGGCPESGAGGAPRRSTGGASGASNGGTDSGGRSNPEGGVVGLGGNTGGSGNVAVGGNTGGSGNASTGGIAGMGGDAGAGGIAGAGGMAGEGGSGGDAGAGGNAGDPEPPIVLLLIDGSLSMFLASAWGPTYEALAGADGPIERYQDRVRFGFASYRGPGETAEDDPACAEITRVPFALDNANSIREVYGALGRRQGYWETPTGHAVVRVTQDLLAEPTEARKYIVLFSDGAPDTCSTGSPQCGQDRAVLAVQQAFRAGVETRAVGVGFGMEYDCNPDESRCGRNHFQDLANAGRGFRVQAPPDAYRALPCAAETGGVLVAEYAQQGDGAPFSWAQTPEEMRSAVEALLEEIVEP